MTEASKKKKGGMPEENSQIEDSLFKVYNHFDEIHLF